jgi:hypothetical protein
VNLNSTQLYRTFSEQDNPELRSWVTEPCALDGDWYKKFGSFILSGTGKYPKTVLKKGMRSFGTAL